MSQEHLSAFLQEIKADPSLQAKLSQAIDQDAVIAIARDLELTITISDLQSQNLLSDEELEGLSGGNKYDSEMFGSCKCPTNVSPCA